MSTTYTSGAKLGKPAAGDRSWGTVANANASALDAALPLSGLMVTTHEQPSASLVIDVAAGRFIASTLSDVVYAGGSLTLAASSTCSIYLTDSGTLTSSTSGFPSSTNLVKLATVVTGSTTITSIADLRTTVLSHGGSLGLGTVTTVSIASANGFAGTVATATSTPAITLTTSITGILKGNGTAISAATSGTDYLPAAGGSSITTVGTITSGTWQGSVIAAAYLPTAVTGLGNATTPTALSANAINYNPGAGKFYRLSASMAVTISGLSLSQVDGQVAYLVNVGSSTITLSNQDGGSTTANQFLTTTGANLSLASNRIALCIYDGTTTAWRTTLLP